MKAVIAATSRFHLFDTAEQLKKRGMLGKLVTGILPSRLGRLALEPEDIAHACFWQSLYFLSVAKIPDGNLLRSIEVLANAAVDVEATYHLEGSQVVIVMGNTGQRAGTQMQRQGGWYVVDRPVLHLRMQNDVLAEAYSHADVPYIPIQKEKIDRAEAEYDQADAIFVPSRVVAESMVKSGQPASKVFVLNQAADMSQFRPTGEPQGEAFVLGFAGNVTVQKGIHVLTEAIEKLKGQKIRLWVAGMVMPEAQKFIKRLDAVCELEVLNKVGVDVLRDYMSHSHAFVLPSVQDGFGLVTPQAMACGTAVIVSDHAGSSEIVKHGENGLVFRSGDSEDLANQILRLIENRDEAYEMGRKCLDSMKFLGGWEDYGDKVEAILRSFGNPVQSDLSYASYLFKQAS